MRRNFSRRNKFHFIVIIITRVRSDNHGCKLDNNAYFKQYGKRKLNREVGGLIVETRRLQHQLVFLYKIKYNLLNISLPQHLVVPCTRTRNSDPNKFVEIPTRINTYAYSFYPRVIRAWNLLPNEILRLSSIDTFHQAVSTVQLAPPAHLNRL